MGKSVNKVILIGNCGKDPDVKQTGGGTLVAILSLAVNERQKDQRGNWQDRVEWVNLKAFARTAEIIRDYVTKGSKLYVEGRIHTDSWDDKQSGQKRYRTEVVVNEIVLLSERGDNGQSSRGQQANMQYGGYVAPEDDEDDISDIPF